MTWELIYAIIVTCLFLGMVIYTIASNSKNKSEKEDIERKRIEIMFSQIKPHFIYNVLNTIYYLCEKDPVQAQKAIEEFSDYLRANLDSVSADQIIPFEQELSHINNYLYLEKLRFEDELRIEYDIKTKDFMVPPLTIQPLVENAVKHGLRGSEDGGTVTISTSQGEDGFTITVTDNGVGYDPHYKAKDTKGRAHVGLANVRERLALMCGGTLDIYTAEGSGTKVTVKIPAKEKKKGRS